MQQIHVAAGAVADSQGRILVTRRPDHAHQGGLWEFPGGKLETGETPQQGLDRELFEELGIRVTSSRPLIRVLHDYGDRHVLLDVHRIEAFAGEPHGREGQPLTWVHPDNMAPEDFPAADRPIITALRLPSLYLITGDNPSDPEAFIGRLSRALEQGVRLVQLRAHELDDDSYKILAEQASAVCMRHGARLLLNRAPDLAAGLVCDGVHLTGERLSGIDRRPIGENKLVGASCHDAEDLERAASLGLDYVLLSPVQETETHPDARPLGWRRFAELVEPVPLPVYALGGLGLADLKRAFRFGAQGVAAIRGLW